MLIEPKRLGQDVAALRRGFEETHPGVPVVVMGDAGLESAIAAMRAGAADYVEASAPAGEIAAIARRLGLRTRDSAAASRELGGQVTRSIWSERARSCASCVSGSRSSPLRRDRARSPARREPARSWSPICCTRTAPVRAGPFVVVGCSDDSRIAGRE